MCLQSGPRPSNETSVKALGRIAVPVLTAAILLTAGASTARSQVDLPILDSIEVVGNQRIESSRVVLQAGIPIGQSIGFRDLQRAIRRLYALGEFDDISISQATIGDREVLRIELVERPIVSGWSVEGVERLSMRSVRGRVTLSSGSAYDAAAANHSKARIDSLYRNEGYYQSGVNVVRQPQNDGTVRILFEVDEGSRVAISEIIIEGNDHFSDAEISGTLATGVEGFLWFKKGEYDDDKLEIDLRERLPAFYASHGFVDFQAIADTLIINESTGKGTLIVSVSEGEQYHVGTFEVVGNRQYSADQIERYYPFRTQATGFLGLGGIQSGQPVYDQAKWQEATSEVAALYRNTGYLRAQVLPMTTRRRTEDGTNLVDLRWQIFEGTPSVVNRINIVGNNVTHEDVIRRAILMVPGDVYREEALIQSYQRISNLNFFNQPLPMPQMTPATEQGDLVDVTFEVEERNTGNFNFGASVGQGTGLGGFLGVEQPNLFGRGKTISFQWQFGTNVSDFNISYTDPAIRGSLVSGSFSLHNTRLRFTVGDLGRIRTRGGRMQIGFPLFGSNFTRVFLNYTLEQSDFDDESAISTAFTCNNCILSSLGFSVLRDTRIDLPFATGGAMHRFDIAQAGGPVGGSGNFRRATFEGRWYAPLARLGGSDPTANPLKFVLGFTAKTGFVWGDPGPHFRQLFSMGGTQFGIPLRGYDEFSITPQGFDAAARGFQANNVDSFGQSYFAMTGEIGLRFSQAFYFSTFLDAGNVWSTPARFNPTHLFRGSGVGLNVLSPLGPIGIDYAYAFDRLDIDGNHAPGWKFHFRLGNIF